MPNFLQCFQAKVSGRTLSDELPPVIFTGAKGCSHDWPKSAPIITPQFKRKLSSRRLPECRNTVAIRRHPAEKIGRRRTRGSVGGPANDCNAHASRYPPLPCHYAAPGSDET
jgi:hypothetical protein